MKTIFILMQIKSFSQEEFCTKRPFEIESFWNSEMANYWEGPYSYIFKFSELSLSLVFIDAQIKVVIFTIPEILKQCGKIEEKHRFCFAKSVSKRLQRSYISKYFFSAML